MFNGSRHTEETKIKISKKLKGRKLSEETCRKMSESRKGRKHSPETIKKLCEARKRYFSNGGKPTRYWNGKKLSLEHKLKLRKERPSIKGEKNSSWKGGITPENRKIRHSIEFGLWREAVFARDNWTCQKTKVKGGKLVSHHIQNFAQFPELRFAIDNGITLSDKAHKEFHKKYGIKNNNKEQLITFLNDYK